MRVMEPAKYSWCFCARAVHVLGAVTMLHGMHLHLLNASAYGVAMFSASVSCLQLVGEENILVSIAFNMYKVLIGAVRLRMCLGT